MTDTPAVDGATISDRVQLKTSWPIILACAAVGAGTILGQATGTPNSATVDLFLFPLIALGLITAAIVALAKAPLGAPTAPFVTLAAATAALLGLLPFDQPAGVIPVSLWLIVSPWRYALPPLMVHFALSCAWPHRTGRWSGPLVGWYVLNATLWLATFYGIQAQETPLLEALDTLARAEVIEPLAWVVAMGAGGLALFASDRSPARRRAIGLATLAIGVSFGPSLLAKFAPGFATTVLGDVTWDRLLPAFFPLLGLAAVVTVPRADPVTRDVFGYRIGAMLLESADLPAALKTVAEKLRVALEGDGIRLQLIYPELTITDGEVDAVEADLNIPEETETISQRRILAAPIGRERKPLGEVRLNARRTGAFGPRESEWLTAVLKPVTAAMRARYKDALAIQQLKQVTRDAEALTVSLGRGLAGMPLPPREDGMGVPPPVDATAVLTQLKTGITSTIEQGETAESRADQVRNQARGTSDQVARALDALRPLSAEIERLSRAGEEIAASNETVSAIAFRTNLLANNAALEATRSGAAGRTFGVLAEEIRRLADTASSTSDAIGERTAALAREVADMATALRDIRSALSLAISDAEGVENSARQLNDVVGLLASNSRAMQPVLEETFAVAGRRTARDARQSATLEQFLTERRKLAAELVAHRETLESLGEEITRLAQARGTSPSR